jgi:hypothetical protein
VLPKQPVFVPKILKEDYETFVSLFAHRIGFPKTHEGWLKQTAKHVAQREKQGCVVKHVTVKPDEFAEWCRTTGLNPEFEYLDPYIVAAERRRK